MNRCLTVTLAALSFLVVPGCLAPQVIGLTPTERMSGLWTDCDEAALHGISGDPCTFSGSCLGSSVAGGPAAAAYCRPDGRLIVDTREAVTGEALDQPRVLDDGCIEHTPLGDSARLCVSDAMLPFAPRETPVDFDVPGACAEMVDATPGFPCSGTTICVFGHVDDSVEGSVPLILRPGILAWCHGARIRMAASIVTLPCEPTEEAGFVSCAY